jgi:hypothetical protein
VPFYRQALGDRARRCPGRECSMDWFAELQFSFRCPKCGQWIPEGNPKECPHQPGKPARDRGKQPVVNAAKRIAALSVQPKAPSKLKADPVKKADALSASALVFPSAQDIVDSSCPRGT